MRHRVLIAADGSDDEAVLVQKLTRRFLAREEQYELDVAVSYEEAKLKLDNGKPIVLITVKEVTPDAFSDALIKYASSVSSETRFLTITSKTALEQNPSRYSAYGLRSKGYTADVLLTFPFSPKELAALVRRLCPQD